MGKRQRACARGIGDLLHRVAERNPQREGVGLHRKHHLYMKDPPERTYPNVSDDIFDADYIARPATYTIAGRVTSSRGGTPSLSVSSRA